MDQMEQLLVQTLVQEEQNIVQQEQQVVVQYQQDTIQQDAIVQIITVQDKQNV